MTHLDRDDRQIMLHNYRQVAEILSLFRKELLAAGLPRFLTGMIVMRQFEMMTRQQQYASTIFVMPPDSGEEER